MNIFRKIFLCSLLISVCVFPAVSQEAEIKSEDKGLDIHPYINIGTQITLNLASKETSAPTPVNFYAGGGAVISLTESITIEPHLDFWMMYYLFDGKDALPAEVEHRTATVLCFMLDVPAGYNFNFGNSTLTPGAGLGFFMRFAMLSNGVKETDSGATGSAQKDTEKIAAWFWKDARFLYPEIFISWDYRISEKLRAGLQAKIYIPMGSIISGKGLDATIFNITSRFIF